MLVLNSLQLNAQKPDQFNPTVHVVNSYESRLGDINRPLKALVVPDSLRQFDLNFDYGGFETPYKGSDEFIPTYTELELAERAFDGRKLYLKAGVGYIPAPFLKAAWTFKDQGVFKAGLHADFDSYFGPYRQIVGLDDKLVPVDRTTWIEGYKYYQAKAIAGMDGRCDWENFSLLMNLDYEGSFGKSAPSGINAVSSYNGLNARLGMASNFDPSVRWTFAAELDYAFGFRNKLIRMDAPLNSFEHNAFVKLYGRRDFRRGSAFDLQIDADFSYDIPRQSLENYFGWTGVVTPRYFFNNDKVYIGIGLAVLVDGIHVAAQEQTQPKAQGQTEDQTPKDKRWPVAIWPVLEFQWTAIPRALDIYADAKLKGGMYGEREDALNHGFYIPHSDAGFFNTRDYRAELGLRGNLWQCFDYDLHGGYNMTANNPLYYVSDGDIQRQKHLSLIFEDTHRLMAGASISVRAGIFTASGHVDYSYYVNNEKIALRSIPAALEAGLDMDFLIARRIKLGMGVDYRSPYTAGLYKTSPIVDLRAKAEYKLNNSVTIFANGSNLLCRSLQYIPMYARKGICITAGATLNF